jgi:hypothetical protein
MNSGLRILALHFLMLGCFGEMVVHPSPILNKYYCSSKATAMEQNRRPRGYIKLNPTDKKQERHNICVIGVMTGGIDDYGLSQDNPSNPSNSYPKLAYSAQFIRWAGNYTPCSWSISFPS